MARRGWTCGVCEMGNQTSECVACVSSSLVERFKELRQLRMKQDALKGILTAELRNKSEADRQRRWRVEHEDRKEKLVEQLEVLTRELPEVKKTLRMKKSDLTSRTELLSEASKTLLAKRMEQLGQNRSEPTPVESPELTVAMNELLKRWRFVIRLLCKALPFQPQGGSDGRGKRDGDTALQICSARLPHEEDPHSVPPAELAASLGYVVQLLNLAARYLCTPLLHSAGYAASSSRVWQRASYWDARPTSRSEEYTLFIPFGTRAANNLDSGCVDSESMQFLGFSAVDKPSMDSVRESARDLGFSAVSRPLAVSGAPLPTHEGNSTFSEYDRDLRQGLQMLKRSMACLLSYLHVSVSLPAPSDSSTFGAFFELLTVLTTKQPRIRSPGGSQHSVSSSSREPVLDAVRTSEMHKATEQAEFLQKSPRSTAPSSYYYLADSSSLTDVMQKVAETLFDGWDMVERPEWPPPPSHADDVEHWMRAMFTDAVK